MKNENDLICILHVCDYAASYKGNFVRSLESLEANSQIISNLYLFPHRVRKTGAEKWINQMNQKEKIVYIQEKSFLKNIFLFRRIMKNHNIDFVIHHFSDFKMDIIVKLLFGSTHVIRFFHSMYQKGNNLKHLIRKFIWNRNVLVGVSNATAKNLERFFSEFDVRCIENAICFDRLEKIDSFDKHITLLTTGYNLKIKGTDLSLAVVKKLREKYDVSLGIVVAGNKENLINYINHTFGCIPEWVTILPPIENIATYYNNSDIFLSPSRKEAFGYAVVETAYCKKSIVASKVDGQAELEIDGVYWFESENIDDFYKKVELAIQQLDSEEIHLLKEKVKEVVQIRYSIERWCDEVVNLIKTDN